MKCIYRKIEVDESGDELLIEIVELPDALEVKTEPKNHKHNGLKIPKDFTKEMLLPMQEDIFMVKDKFTWINTLSSKYRPTLCSLIEIESPLSPPKPLNEIEALDDEQDNIIAAISEKIEMIGSYPGYLNWRLALVDNEAIVYLVYKDRVINLTFDPNDFDFNQLDARPIVSSGYDSESLAVVWTSRFFAGALTDDLLIEFEQGDFSDGIEIKPMPDDITRYVASLIWGNYDKIFVLQSHHLPGLSQKERQDFLQSNRFGGETATNRAYLNISLSDSELIRLLSIFESGDSEISRFIEALEHPESESGKKIYDLIRGFLNSSREWNEINEFEVPAL